MLLLPGRCRLIVRTYLFLILLLWMSPLGADEIIFSNNDLTIYKLDKEPVRLVLEGDPKRPFLGEDGGGLNISISKWFKDGEKYSFFLKKNKITYGVLFRKKPNKFLFFQKNEEELTVVGLRVDKSLKVVLRFDDDGVVSKIQTDQGLATESVQFD